MTARRRRCLPVLALGLSAVLVGCATQKDAIEKAGEVRVTLTPARKVKLGARTVELEDFGTTLDAMGIAKSIPIRVSLYRGAPPQVIQHTFGVLATAGYHSVVFIGPRKATVSSSSGRR